MSNDTESASAADTTESELQTSGHVERTILHALAGDGETVRPATVGSTLPAITAVIERGEYGNLGPRAERGVAQKSTVRRAFGQLAEKGLVRRVTAADDLPEWVDLGERTGDAGDVTDYEHVSDDGRVTDWVLTAAGRREVERLDARYAAELDELAARYGRPRGETTTRVDA